MPEIQDEATANEAQSAFSKWSEADINDVDYARGDTDAPAKITETDVEDDPEAFLQMFGKEADEDVYEDVQYDYNNPPATTTVMIRHHADYPNSTGLAVWRGSEILARFLCDQQRLCDETSDGVVQVRQKKVLEVGAGAGLPGIVAHKVLGAHSVLVTDGDYDALVNCQRNVAANQNSEIGDISCQQLIWGRGVGAFLETHGKQDVVLAADCVYMVPSLKPLWKTIDVLLKEDGIFVYAQTAASAVPWKNFSEMVDVHGFEVCFQVVGQDLKQYDVDNEDSDDGNDCREDEEYELGIYVFRRRR